MVAAAPLITAGAAAVGAGAAVYGARQQSDTAKKGLLMQKDAFGREQERQRKQEMMQMNKKAKLQEQLSDEARNARKGGKRSLISAGAEPETLGVRGGF